MGPLRDGRCTLLIISRRNLIGIGNVSDNLWENQSAHFLFNIFSTENFDVHKLKFGVQTDR